MKYLQKLGLVFALSFALNVVWENAHAVLYTAYKGAPITEFILLRATLGDAIILTLLALPFVYFSFFAKRRWLVVPAGLVIAVAIEIYALHTGRWSYAETMPLIPFFNVGLTPTLQLGTIGLLSFYLLL